MSRLIRVLLLFSLAIVQAQTDFSQNWIDFYSYNNVKDFVFDDDIVYALSDNAVFTYDITIRETEKLSSVNGLSGEETSSIFFSESTDRLVIGYDSGLLEIVDEDDNIIVAPDIVNFNQTGLKSINDIFEYEGNLYLSTAFAVIVYDIENLEFGDTFFIGEGSSEVFANQITVFNDEIYAATNSGIYVADVNANNLIDATNWNQISTDSFQNITVFNNQVYAVSNNVLYQINGTTLSQELSFLENIVDVKSTATNITIAFEAIARIYDTSLSEINTNVVSPNFSTNITSANFFEGAVYLGTSDNGILTSTLGGSNYEEIHPQGPLSNDVFALDVFNRNLWVVFGGFDGTFTPSQNRQGFSHFNGEDWINTPFDSSNPNGDFVAVTIDENAENRVFISSFGDTSAINTPLTGGLLEVENDEKVNFLNSLNSPLEDIVPNNPNRITVRISGTAFDAEGNLWVTNVESDFKLKEMAPDGTWRSFDINSLFLDNAPGMTDIVIDDNDTKWVGSRANGVFVFNENENRRVGLTTEANRGSLPNARVESLAIDQNNNVWIGTLTGLVVFFNARSIFDTNNFNAVPIIIEENGIPERLLGEQTITAIAVDGANNKWFGTDGGGTLNTNPSGSNTLANFNTTNSPLPSNRIQDIVIDDSTGLVYFATDRGIVAFNSNVAPFGDRLGEVYAFPNPVLKNNETVTIAGRNGTSLPENTNIKILDTAGNLVFETNVTEGQGLNGGKIVWNKRNLRGTKVASGIYIVLLATQDGSESQTTKIAIIN